MKKPEDYLKGKIKDCTNTNSIFNTTKYVEKSDVIRIIREVMIDCLEQANEEEETASNCTMHGVSNWVAVKDQLPPDKSKKYLVIRNGNVESDRWIFNGTDGFWWDYIGITHWCEIPELPCC